ncbi:hypothetical protein FACS1894174_09740 [Bacteroidia bacterium]|nr:hypothetical protein FACS1894174_09740 [Bacteroidia bacterium]
MVNKKIRYVRMKNLNFKLYSVLAFSCILLFASCKEDNLSNEAEIIISFKVTNETGSVFNATIGNDNTVTIKVSPYVEAKEALKSAKPSFYLSKGATVTPDPAIPQNFAQEGGVKYTVVSEDQKNKRDYIVTWGISDKLPFGSGFSYAEIGTKKDFTQLGYPGEVNNFNLSDSKLYGDLQMYHAYCDAYKQVGLEIEAGNFIPDKKVRHTHEGSIGNLCNDKIASMKQQIISDFRFEVVNQSIEQLMLF